MPLPSSHYSPGTGTSPHFLWVTHTFHSSAQITAQVSKRPPFPTGTSTATEFFSPNPTQPAAWPLLLTGGISMPMDRLQQGLWNECVYFIFFVGLAAPWKHYQKALWRAWTCIQPRFPSRSTQQLQKSSLLSTATARLRSWISVPAWPQGKEGKAAAVVMAPLGGCSFQRPQSCYSLMAEFFPTAKRFCLDQAARMGFDLCYVDAYVSQEQHL